jgi:hypothetical protein
LTPQCLGQIEGYLLTATKDVGLGIVDANKNRFKEKVMIFEVFSRI